MNREYIFILLNKYWATKERVLNAVFLMEYIELVTKRHTKNKTIQYEGKLIFYIFNIECLMSLSFCKYVAARSIRWN